MSGFIQWNNPEIFQQNNNFNGPADAGAGSGTGLPNGNFMTNNQISVSPHLQNYYINHHMTWDSQGVEPYLQSTLVPMPPNLYDNQHAYIPLMLPEPHVSFGYSFLNKIFSYHTLLIFPISRYPFIIKHENIFIMMIVFSKCRYDNQNNQYHSQVMMPDGHVEQGLSSFVQLSGG
ncbi:hypothetical protein Lalb_Chr11g0065561 [Lupinus albus]|uniref:Uncharacterized protein n=1 Tax=Lupinus albus TaxID=3870 RepID=A0A6A4PQY4_LUPAL|nr:hypothetical protein Lalb_Chr11g0065561 [Lupinus albus]